MKKRFLILLTFIFISLLTACSSTASKNYHTHKTVQEPLFKDTPTLYFHGLMGSVKNEEPLIKAAKRANATNSVIRANVDKTGKVKLKGEISRQAKNPIVKVNFADNIQPSFKRNGLYASNVVKVLQKKYHIKTVNMIGYSLGNMAIIHYVLQNGNNSKMPRLVKMVNLAGHFDGAYFEQLPAEFRAPKGLRVSKNGKPNKMNKTYQEMLQARPIFNKHPVDVLNIIGNIGNDSDGVVQVASAQSLKYIVGQKSYHELIIKTDHGTMPSNSKAIRAVVKFLWK